MHLWSHRLIYLILLLVLLAGVPLLQQLMTHDQVASDGVAHRNIALSVPFDTEQIKTDVIVMMFGYVGCADVCTPLLMHLSHWYNSEAMRENRDAVRVVFVNLTPEARITSYNVCYTKLLRLSRSASSFCLSSVISLM